MMYTIDGRSIQMNNHTHEEWVRSERYEYCEGFTREHILLDGIQRFVSFFLF